MLIYRVSNQLKENIHITKENVVKKLSSVGLRLEHIMATLAKNKQKFYNLESINTDTSNKYPPEFMNIKFYYARENQVISEPQDGKNKIINLHIEDKDEELLYLEK
jgi:hypothetical protein